MIGETDWGMVWGDKVGEWMRVGGKGYIGAFCTSCSILT